jgi:transmembrane sensor
VKTALEIEQQAADLLSRVDADPTSSRLQDELARWVAADPRHEVAYLRLRATWRHLDRLKALRSHELAAAQFQQPDVPDISGREPRRRRVGRAAALGSITLAVATLGWFALRHAVGPVVISTPVGGYERRILADGSTLELNTDSAVEIDIDSHGRRLRLLRGEGRFRVADDPRRPFTVRAGSHSARALGTDFAVRLMSKGGAEIVVREGRVGLMGGATDASTGIALSSGQVALAQASGVQVSTLDRQELEAHLAWDRGLLVFTNETLAQVVAEFNRYNTTKLQVGDAAAAQLRVDGTFRATNLEAFLRLLKRGFPVAVTHSSDTAVTIVSQVESPAAN